MDKAEIKQIADYLKELEEGLDLQGHLELTDLGHVSKLHLIIKRLMDATFTCKDQQIKVLLANLKHKARMCKDCIETRLAVKN
jgi:hypothetical protein